MNTKFEASILITVSALAGSAIIANVPVCPEIDRLIDCLEKLGACFLVSDDTICCTAPLRRQSDPVLLDCGKHKDIFALILPLTAALCDSSASIFCTAADTECRALCESADVFLNGCKIEFNKNIASVEGHMHNGCFIPPEDSMLTAGLLLTLPLLPGKSSVVANGKFTSFTLDAMRRAQIIVEQSGNSVIITGIQKYYGCDTYIQLR